MEKRGRRSKKAQTSILVIILIILISIVAFFILWNVLNPLIREKSKEIEESGEVLTVNLEVKEVILFVTGASRVSVRRGVGKGEIDELKFVFYDEQENSYVEAKKDAISELETKTYYFFPSENLGKIESVSVFPVFGKSVGLEAEAKTNKILEIPRGLVSWWRFDGNSEDFIGNNNCGDVDIVDSEREKVASFSGSSINCGDNAELSINNKIAVSFWVKTNSDGGIIKKGDGNKNYEVSLNEGKVDFSYTKVGLKSGASDSKINDGEWHHVVLSRDWSGDEYLRIYIDGNLDKIVSMPEVPDINAENVLIGNNFNGLIDEVMFFNESLSKPAAEALYNNQKK